MLNIARLTRILKDVRREHPRCHKEPQYEVLLLQQSDESDDTRCNRCIQLDHLIDEVTKHGARNTKGKSVRPRRAREAARRER